MGREKRICEKGCLRLLPLLLLCPHSSGVQPFFFEGVEADRQRISFAPMMMLYRSCFSRNEVRQNHTFCLFNAPVLVLLIKLLDRFSSSLP